MSSVQLHFTINANKIFERHIQATPPYHTIAIKLTSTYKKKLLLCQFSSTMNQNTSLPGLQSYVQQPTEHLRMNKQIKQTPLFIPSIFLSSALRKINTYFQHKLQNQGKKETLTNTHKQGLKNKQNQEECASTIMNKKQKSYQSSVSLPQQKIQQYNYHTLQHLSQNKSLVYIFHFFSIITKTIPYEFLLVTKQEYQQLIIFLQTQKLHKLFVSITKQTTSDILEQKKYHTLQQEQIFINVIILYKRI
eukprot:TRINITY_DN10123_c0_g1_i15.p2 TRINITY_DN10123_c0_g1~~TRINITY_DN10123_c0_g1_i15.p2  ORF type:complete len:248 (+),score=-7.49 TRINITY_DN10123_c0_g1_i15:74-817(+)